MINKKYIGGYKDKVSNKIYHHATVQTSPAPWKHDNLIKYHRDSQTIEVQDKSLQTSKDACTQVQAKNIFMNSSNDMLMEESGNFKYADDIEKDFEKKVITIQKHIRGWLAKQELHRRQNAKLNQHLANEEKKKNRERRNLDWIKSLENRRLNPKTEEDFQLIFSDLQKWWDKEAKTINTERSGSDLKAAMRDLVNVEVKKIEEINKRKTLSLEKQESEHREKTLEKVARPKLWRGYNSVVQVETQSTHKGKSMKELYNTLCIKYLSSHERVAALSSLKEMLQPYNTKLSANLVQLANREIDLLIRGTKADRLDGLRNRIRDLFWQFVKQPISIQRSQSMDKNLHQILCCASCKRFYTLKQDTTSEDLRKSVTANCFVKCDKCCYIENEAWVRKDLEHYKKLIKFLIQEEEKTSNISGLIYIMQPTDIQYLVEKIWNRQSCISGSTDEKNLELTRYDCSKSWTPWNCLLVTRQEAETIQSSQDLQIKYDKKFKECVAQRHTEARMYFATIPRFIPYILNS